MTTLSPIALGASRGAAVAFAISACAFLVYREHVRAQPLEVVSEPAAPQAEQGSGTPSTGYFVDPAELFLDPTPVNYEVPPGLPGLADLPRFDAYPSDFLFSSKSMPITILPLTTEHDEDRSYEVEALPVPPPPTYFPSSKSAVGLVPWTPPASPPEKP